MVVTKQERTVLIMFYPNWLVDNVLAITPQHFKQHHIQAVLVDVDNTLVPYDAVTVGDDVVQWVNALKAANIAVVLVSNNYKKRIAKIANTLNVPFVASAKKPFASGFKKALSFVDVPKEAVVIIGDQLFTDVLGGYCLNIRTILVRSLSRADVLPTKVIRYVEKFVLKRLQKKYNLNWRKTIGK